MAFGIIVKNYEHYNRALGKHIRSKAHYEEEMRKGGFVSFEEGQRLAESCKKRKEYVPSKKCVEIVNTLERMKEKKITLSQHPRLVKAMKDGGVKFNTPDWCPSHYKEGSFK